MFAAARFSPYNRSMHSYQLFNRTEYFDHLINQYKKARAGDRIILATMEFRPDQAAISDIVNGLCIAAKNGAHVTFLVDAYSLMLKDGSVLGPLFFSKRDPKVGYGHFRKVISAINTLRESGVNCVVINKPSRPLKNPFGGRSHIKFAVINNDSFIGGCNLSHPEQIDVMVKTTNAKLANYLNHFTANVIEHRNVRKAMNRTDVTFAIDDETELLIDSGVKRKSVIYDRAFELIDKAAKQIYMTCQYFPNNHTPAALTKAAERGVAVHLAYNHPNQHRSPIRGAQKRTVAFKKKRLHLSVFENQLHEDKNYLHAKILLSEKEVIIGSHNFVAIGVSLGTAEIALKSSSPSFIKTAHDWVESI